MKWPTSKNGTPPPRPRDLAQSPHLRNLQCSPRETESADGLARPFHYFLTLFSVLSSPSCPVSALGREVLTAHPKLLTSYPAQVSPVHLVLIPIADWAPQLHWNWSLTLCNPGSCPPGVLRTPYRSHPVQNVKPTGLPDE